MAKKQTKEEYKLERKITREKFMTQDEIKRIDGYRAELLLNQGDMSSTRAEWEKIEEAYRADQAKKEGRPNTRINILLSNIEAQTAALVDQNIAVVTRGEGVSDSKFAEHGRVLLDWTLRKNSIKEILQVFCRRFILYGNAILKVYFDPDALNGFGMVKFYPVPLTKIYIDTTVKDPLRFQEASYIAEVCRHSKEWFIEQYGEEKASAIDYGSNELDELRFNEESTTEDNNTAALVYRYSRHKGKLRLEEFSGCGALLWDSHKSGDRTDNQKKMEYNHKSYNDHVNDGYPYFFLGLYPNEGNLWGFGDGKLIRPLNNMINELYDKIRICARPNLILYDTNLEVDLEDVDENSLAPRPVDGSPTTAVASVPWGSVNESWWRLISSIHQELQRVTRFSDLMLGQRSSTETATEASIQQQQGNSATDNKKSLIQSMLVRVCEYALGLMMDNYSSAKQFRITEDKDEFAWIDPRQMANIPAMIPATSQFKDEYMANNPGSEPPEWEALTDKSGKPITKKVEFDIEINIGAGLPKNKAFLYQMAERISQMVIQGQNVITLQEMRKFLKDFLGLPLDDMPEEGMPYSQQMPMAGNGMTMQGGMPPQGGMPQGMPQGMPPEPSDIQTNVNGNPNIQALPMPPNTGGMR